MRSTEEKYQEFLGEKGKIDFDDMVMNSIEKLKNDDINFIEQEFNDFMLEDGLKSLFLFPKFKEFIKSITSETN